MKFQVDTSVWGGFEDREFSNWTIPFFEQARQGGDQSELLGTIILKTKHFFYFFIPYFFLEKKVTKIQGFIKFPRKSIGSLSRRSDHFPTKGSEKRCAHAQPYSKKSPNTI